MLQQSCGQTLLLNRGITYGQQGKTELALADFTTLINSPKTPPEIKTLGLLNRAMAYGQQEKTELQETDYKCVIGNSEAPPRTTSASLTKPRGTLWKTEKKQTRISQFYNS